MSGSLQSDGTMDITMLSAPFPQMQTKVASDGTFSQDTTVQGYAIHYEGKVEVQPGAQHKFIVSGTFTSNGSTNGTFVLRALDWQALDGVKAQMGAGGNGVPPRIAFASETLGFASWSPNLAPIVNDSAASSSLWRTDDGGATWNPAGTVSGVVTDMRFAGGRLWVATDTGLWSSQDQGLSFSQAIRLSSEISNDNYGMGTGTLLMDFFDGTHGVLLNLNTGKVWVTLDGGKTWNTRVLLNEPGWPFGDSGSVQMLSPSEAVALVPSSAGPDPALYRTLDGGLTWNKVAPSVSPVPPASGPAVMCGGGRTSDVRFINSNKGWAFAGQCLATTEDGGVTWTWSGSTVLCNSTARLVAATASRVFVGCQYGALKVTTDGGSTFQDVPNIVSGVTSMKVMADGSGLLVSNAKLYSSSDGGATWTAQPTALTDTISLAPVSATEWWNWTSLGLEHVSQSGAAREVVLVKGRFTELRATSDALWTALDSGAWLVLPLTGGAPQAVSAPGRMWPLSRTTLVAEIQDTIDHPELQLGLGLSTDGGQTWKNIVGLTGNLWTVCAADATRAWIAGNGAYYLLENGNAQLVYTDPSGNSPDQMVFCDASRLWFLDNGAPKLLSGGLLTEQAVPMEWKSSKVSALVNGETLASAVSESAAWLALSDGRILRFMNDAAYAAYQGSAMLGTAPVAPNSNGSTSPSGTPPTGTGGTASVSGNRPPVLGEISSVARYTYDVDGNYMGGTIQLSTFASDPDGDQVTITWTLSPSSGGPSLSSTTGYSTILILDSFASGSVRATASDGKGGSDTRSFSFSRPAGSY
jgi:hypothetical protein